ASAQGLVDIAGTGEDLVICGVGVDFDAAKAGEGAGIEDVAGIFMRFGFSEGIELAGIAGADEDRVTAIFGEAESLLCFKVGNVGVVPVLLNAEDVSAIAAEGEYAIGLRCQGVDDVVFAGPDFLQRLVGREGVDFSAFGGGRACVGSLQRAGLNNGEGDAAYALDGEWRQGIVALVANTGGEDGAVGGDGDGCDFAARCFKEEVAFALRADARHEAGAVGAGDQISFGTPGKAANV